jgi:hypothetical protein
MFLTTQLEVLNGIEAATALEFIDASGNAFVEGGLAKLSVHTLTLSI